MDNNEPIKKEIPEKGNPKRDAIKRQLDKLKEKKK
jgi:hypothetical protein